MQQPNEIRQFTALKLLTTFFHATVNAVLRRKNLYRGQVSPVVTKEDKIPLIVVSDHLATFELGVVRVKSGEHSSDGVSETSREIVQNNLQKAAECILRQNRTRHTGVFTQKNQEEHGFVMK